MGWVSRYGLPCTIVSDRGRQFTSELWSHLGSTLGAKIKHTSAYHPQSKGILERLHRDLKAALRAGVEGPCWIEQLPWVLLGLRTTPKEDLPVSSADCIFRNRLRLPADVTQPKRSVEVPPTPLQTSHHHKTDISVPAELWNSPFVLVRVDAHRTPLEKPYSGPYRVISRSS